MGWILSGMMLLVLAGIVILNLFRGKKRGVVRTGISVCILIASAFVAIIASRKVSVVIAEAIVTAMRKSDDMQEVLHELPSLAPFITAAIGMLISVTVFFCVLLCHPRYSEPDCLSHSQGDGISEESCAEREGQNLRCADGHSAWRHGLLRPLHAACRIPDACRQCLRRID